MDAFVHCIYSIFYKFPGIINYSIAPQHMSCIKKPKSTDENACLKAQKQKPYKLNFFPVNVSYSKSKTPQHESMTIENPQNLICIFVSFLHILEMGKWKMLW